MAEPVRDPNLGWICPTCQATYAPWVASCPRCPMCEFEKHPFMTTTYRGRVPCADLSDGTCACGLIHES